MTDDGGMREAAQVPPLPRASASPPPKSRGEKTEKRCAAVILAAGEAVRLGVAKPALAFRDGSMVSSVIESATSGGLEPVVVVTGYHRDEVASAVGESARLAHNPNPSLGNMSSLLVGIEAAGDVDVVIVLLADMPQVDPRVVEGLRNGMRVTGSDVGWTEYASGRGHPIALAAQTFNAVAELTGSKALWPFFDTVDADRTYRLSVMSEAPVDVNTPADYESVISVDSSE